MPTKQQFIVTCAGMSGSKWLASSLDKHPEISCSHSAGLHKIYNRNYTDEEIIDILKIERDQFDGKILLNDIFHSVNSTNRVIRGNVHAYRLYRLKEAILNDKKAPIFRLVNLVRNPIDVTLSRAAMFNQMCISDETVRQRVAKTLECNINIFNGLITKYKLNTKDYNILSFIDAVLGMQKLSDEIKNNPDVNHIKIEELKEPKIFIKLIDFLGSGEINTTLNLAKKIISAPIINSHTKIKSLSVEEKYMNLDNWKKDALNIGFRETEIILQYKKLNYNFDVLQENECIK